MSAYRLKELVEEQAKAQANLLELGKKVREEKRSFNSLEKQQDDEIKNRLVALAEEIDTEKRLYDAEQVAKPELRIDLGVKPKASPYEITEQDKEWALRAAMIDNAVMSAPSSKRDRVEKFQRDEYRNAADKCGVELGKPGSEFEFRLNLDVPWWLPPEVQKMRQEQRSGQTLGGASAWNQNGATFNTGGALANQSILIGELTVYTKHTGAMLDASNLKQTETGDYAWNPNLDDSSSSASVHTENAQMDVLDVTFGHRAIPAFVYDSFCLATLELIQDSRYPIVDVLKMDVQANRIARKFNSDATVGNGSGLPHGIKADLVSNGTTYTSDVSGIFDAQDITNALMTPDWSYIQDPSYGIMMSQSFYKNTLGLTDSANRPLVNLNMDALKPFRDLLGYRIFINNDLDSVAAGNYPALSFAFRHSWVRQVGEGITTKILNERFIYDQMAVGVGSYARWGYRIVNPAAGCVWRVKP